MGKIFAVIGSDHYYDAGSQWLVGVYSTQELADAAAKRDRKSYSGWIKPSQVVYDTVECEIDQGAPEQ